MCNLSNEVPYPKLSIFVEVKPVEVIPPSRKIYERRRKNKKLDDLSHTFSRDQTV